MHEEVCTVCFRQAIDPISFHVGYLIDLLVVCIHRVDIHIVRLPGGKGGIVLECVGFDVKDKGCIITRKNSLVDGLSSLGELLQITSISIGCKNGAIVQLFIEITHKCYFFSIRRILGLEITELFIFTDDLFGCTALQIHDANTSGFAAIIRNDHILVVWGQCKATYAGDDLPILSVDIQIEKSIRLQTKIVAILMVKLMN